MPLYGIAEYELLSLKKYAERLRSEACLRDPAEARQLGWRMEHILRRIDGLGPLPLESTED